MARTVQTGVWSTFTARPAGSHETPNKHQTHMNKLTMKGDWNIAKGKLKQKWAKLTEDDLRYEKGKEEELLGRIQKRTGEAREVVEKYVRDSCDC